MMHCALSRYVLYLSMRICLIILFLLPLNLYSQKMEPLTQREFSLISANLFGQVINNIEIPQIADLELKKFNDSYEALVGLANRPLTNDEKISFITSFVKELPKAKQKIVFLKIKKQFLSS